MADRGTDRKPIVFISSTVEDLELFREKARDAALTKGFDPRMMEYFVARSNKPLAECLSRVSGSAQERGCDLLIVIAAHRLGWVPPGQCQSPGKSITWLECEEARKNGKDVLAFLVDEKADWPNESRDEFEITDALRNRQATPELLGAVQARIDSLQKFKAWLNEHCTRSFFKNSDDLKFQIAVALQDWLNRNPGFRVNAPGGPGPYLQALRKETASIDIRGLQVGSGKASRFPIEDLYITLRTTAAQRPNRESKQRPERDIPTESIRLEQALEHSRLVVIGDPGSGKTTFLRRICQLACRSRLDHDAEALKGLGFEKAPFPMLVRLSELEEHRTARKGHQGAPALAASPDWLTHFLASQTPSDGLDAAFFERLLNDRSALLLLDGLDEASGDRERASLVQLIEKAADRWEDCRMVVTSRPATYQGESVLSGFAHASIEALGDEAIRTFLSHWCRALFPNEPEQAESHLGELSQALSSRYEIRRMARNPVMLTALAVVHWNEKRIPEQRADLYESILTWLSRSRQQLPHRVSPERSLGLLQSLALAMHDHPQGRRVQAPRRCAAEAIAPAWRELPETERIAAAERFLDQEEKDSGIVVRRGTEVRFWHLSFQEYLAARALAGLTDMRQHERILKRLYEPEWREAVLLLAGILHGQGVDRVDSLFTAALDRLGDDSSLRERARCAGLLGAVLRDLKPLQYQPADSRYEAVLDQALAIFDRERSQGTPIREAIEAAEALGQAGDPRLEPAAQERNWVEIPAGEFWMGSQKEDDSARHYDPEAYEDESPVHQVYLDAYRIGRYAVTVTEYARFVQEKGYEKEEHWQAKGFGQFSEPENWEEQQQHPNRPVVGVSWYEASAYANWVGAQLPSEAQWERAARGESGGKYPWGDDEPRSDLLNCDGNVGEPTPVGVYPRGCSPEGIADLAGNVREWCRDWFEEEYYSKSPKRNPSGPEKGSGRVLRGGAWSYVAWSCRASIRNHYRPSNRSDIIGFRLVLVGCSARTVKRKP